MRPHPPKRKTDQYNIQIPTDLSPEDALEVVLGLCYEMRHPMNKIEDWASILTDPDSFELHEQATSEILQWVEGLRYILRIIYAYDASKQDE